MGVLLGRRSRNVGDGVVGGYLKAAVLELKGDVADEELQVLPEPVLLQRPVQQELQQSRRAGAAQRRVGAAHRLLLQTPHPVTGWPRPRHNPSTRTASVHRSMTGSCGTAMHLMPETVETRACRRFCGRQPQI